MKVKELKELLNEVDENENVLFCNENNKPFEIDGDNIGEVIFQGTCDEEGNILSNGMDEENDVKAFMIQFKTEKSEPNTK